MKHGYLLAVMAVSALLASCKTENRSLPAVIPMPVQMEAGKGFFTLEPSASISYTGGAEGAAVAEQLASLLRPATGFALNTAEDSDGDIRLLIDTTGSWRPEEYGLSVAKSRVTLTAATPKGLFRGIQTVRQLLPPQAEGSAMATDVDWVMPCVDITDYPRFEWRGMHLDVSRHFFDVDFIRRYIDILAMHKLNVFHWHLVDDQGWRIEIKKYPRLTGVGAWRVDREEQPWNSREPQRPGEKATYGGFYTQEEIKEIVAYATERYITVVPEIEMPAHVGSALAAYPEYSCTGGPFTVPPGGVWPITDIYCAGKEETFTFLEDVLTEVMELFPSPWIHVGGDEADKSEWRRCPDCHARIRNEELQDEDELQSYFIRRIEKFLNSQGRRLIGWDEILQGGLAPEATVMSWQGFEGGVAAAKSEHQAVMAPVSHCYFNVYQGDPATEPESFTGLLTLKKVYSFEPVPPELTPEEAEYIIGAQGCLWTEYVTDGRTAEYMILPRLTAFSEVVWSPRDSRSWKGFTVRLPHMMERFDAMGLAYSKGSYSVEMTASYNEELNSITLTITSEQPSPEIRYTTDGSEPGPVSTVYEAPLPLDSTTTVKAAIFADGEMIGRVNAKTVNINQATGRAVTYNIPFNNRYKAFGDKTLVNGIRGSGAFDDGQWQGFEETDMDVMIDLGSEMAVALISSRFMANVGSWIFLPEKVEYSASADGESFTPVHAIVTDLKPEEQGSRTEEYFASFPPVTARYIRVVARGLGTCPPWHAGAGGKAWLFCDEIIVE
ncbi:MAG: family 20 glycosylhydrolase [Bacteroidales bacterium]|nr:family 20 glycosylhydrolase [Bacteroidales bacterium]MDT8374813.1 family 20 glycosylhydrolase [Bacteroidales bacterium]